MNKYALLLNLVTALLFLSPHTMAAKTAGTPSLEIPSPLIDMGKVQEGEHVNACYELINTGSSPLHILGVKAGFRCIELNYPEKIQPNARGQLCLRIDTMGYGGKRRFKTGIYTDDPGQKMQMLRTAMDLQPLLTLTPDRATLQGPAGSGLVEKIIIKTTGKIPFDMRLVANSLEGTIDAELSTMEKGKQYQLTVQTIALGSGTHRGRLYLETNYPGREKIVVPVFLRWIDPITVRPAIIELKASRSQTCEEQSGIRKLIGSFIVRAQDQQPLQILSVGTDHQECSSAIMQLIPDTAYRITLTCSKQGTISHPKEVVFVTDRKDATTIKVPIKSP